MQCTQKDAHRVPPYVLIVALTSADLFILGLYNCTAVIHSVYYFAI